MIRGHGDDGYGYQAIRINFSSNICQHADHAALKAHLTAHLDVIANYPQPEPWTLERRLADKLGIDKDCVLVTNGTTDAIYLVAQAYAHLPYHIEKPTFSEYEDACRMMGCQTGRGGMAWVCNPNNPTGTTLTISEIRERVGDCRLLVIDQAYEHYTNHEVLTAQEAIGAENIILLHSMTKTYAVPGLRLGYVTAAAPIIRQLRQYLRPWAVNALAIEAATFLLAHDELVVRPDLQEAQRLRQRLNAIPRITVEETTTNFMLCRIANCTAELLKDRLAIDHMLIRDASNFFENETNVFRVAAQLPEENDQLVDKLTTLCQNERIRRNLYD